MSGARQISFEDAPFSAIHKKITAGTFMGQISDGYTLGIVGISLNYAMEPLGLTSFWMASSSAAFWRASRRIKSADGLSTLHSCC